MSTAAPVLKVVYLPNYPRDAAELFYAHAGDAGFDLRAAIESPITLSPMSRAIIPAGVRFGIPDGHEIQIRPRSGLAAKFGVTVLNSPGTVDAGYIDEVKVILANLSTKSFEIQPGERIAQAVLAPVTRAVFATVEALDDTERGMGGLGSTGRV